MQLITLLATATLASAAVLPKSLEARNKDVLPGHCCFTLKDSSGNTVQQASSGQVHIASSYPSGWYCLDISSSSSKVLRDDPNNACIVDSRGQLMCVDPIPGAVAWTLGSGGELKYGGSTTFSNCGGKVYGGSRSGCKTTTLKASGKKGTC